MSVRLMRELLHKYQNPHHFNEHDMDEEVGASSSVPKRIPSKMGTVQRAHMHGESSKMMVTSNSSNISNNINNNNDSQLSPPETLPSEMSLSSYMDAQWDRMTLSHGGANGAGPSSHRCNHAKEDSVKTPSSSHAMATGVSEESPKRHNSMDRLVGMFNDLGSSSNRQRSLSDSEQQQPDILNNLNNTPPVPPKRKHRHRSPPFQASSNGLPPTPKVSLIN